MKAIQITKLDGPSTIELVDIEHPKPAHDQILISVRAAGVGFPELLRSRGLYHEKPPLPYTPGSEVAGVVISAPKDSGFVAGDRVAAIATFQGPDNTALPMIGGFAEQAVAAVDMTFALPDGVSFEQGASLPLNYLTAYFALIERGHFVSGESVLVHGAAGGVGTAAIQIAKAFGASRIIAVTSTPEKGAIAVAAGADEFVLADGFGKAMKAFGGVDIVVDPVGGERFTDSLRSLKENGRILILGFTAGTIPSVQVNRLMLNNISVIGVGWNVYKRPGHLQAQWTAIKPHVQSGVLSPVVGKAFRFQDASEALLALEQRIATGKVVLVP
ncbi:MULTISPECIES: NADPH:quinone oxidoreductase family protein [Paraburkholderia]|uniref:NADPH:quinone oxidoreductase family protein n=1 Tax=Paraburkholderia TaxID=1822464 RepID=UPI002259EA4F|nr:MULTISPECIES: NADPH:quinone oxidoreductase family protein [Paraburkholderia]MCX4174586.1 NADPH:quinone oxidoreductase family protein [Paraburkholderia madseniana]MDQ6462587.1 NADPH:quinone oxidoreductase family protein [Paraburkholderia madseniana]